MFLQQWNNKKSLLILQELVLIRIYFFQKYIIKASLKHIFRGKTKNGRYNLIFLFAMQINLNVH